MVLSDREGFVPSGSNRVCVMLPGPCLRRCLQQAAGRLHGGFGLEDRPAVPGGTRGYVACTMMKISITATAICSASTAVFMVITLAK